MSFRNYELRNPTDKNRIAGLLTVFVEPEEVWFWRPYSDEEYPYGIESEGFLDPPPDIPGNTLEEKLKYLEQNEIELL